MVISSKTQTSIYIPAVVGDASGLTLTSEITKQEYAFSIAPQYAGDYYVFEVNLTDVPEGEYVYKAGGDSGIIRIGTYVNTTVSYNAKNKHIEYNAFE